MTRRNSRRAKLAFLLSESILASEGHETRAQFFMLRVSISHHIIQQTSIYSVTPRQTRKHTEEIQNNRSTHYQSGMQFSIYKSCSTPISTQKSQ